MKFCFLVLSRLPLTRPSLEEVSSLGRGKLLKWNGAGMLGPLGDEKGIGWGSFFAVLIIMLEIMSDVLSLSLSLEERT
jgi:hypothetical protein